MAAGVLVRVAEQVGYLTLVLSSLVMNENFALLLSNVHSMLVC